MHLHTLLPLIFLRPSLTAAEPVRIPAQQHDVVLDARARPDAPSGDYAPAIVPCPSERPTIRSAGALSKSETDWLAKRRPATVQPMIDFLKRANIDGFDAEAYINKVAPGVKDLPNVAIAVSGGGYRALMNGAGFVAAADSRTPGSTGKGGIGGLLQASTYLAGLSGGGWLVSSIYANNFSTVVALRDGRENSSIWKFDRSIFVGPELPGAFDTARYWSQVTGQVSDKKDAGYVVTVTDYWGRTLSYQLIDAPRGGPAYTFSSITQDDDFSKAQAPLPILVADGRAPGTKAIPLNATVYEFSPFEMGSWDPTTFGFAPTAYLASNFSAGVIPSGGKCVRGFDSLSYVFGTSSSLFNAFLLQNITSIKGVPDFLIQAATNLLNVLDNNGADIAQWTPNPFLGWNNATNPSSQTAQLDLVDGGMNLENLPLQPLIQSKRSIDVIIAVDSSADTVYSWPNGSAIRATYGRSQLPIANGTLFPPVPDDVTFVALGLNNRPTFFGCDPRNFSSSTTKANNIPPLLVYLPNAPYTAASNVTTFTMEFPLPQRDAIIRNGYNAATQGNATLDAKWPACVACAVLSRSLARTGTAVPAVCAACFERYCWNGTTVAKGAGGAEYQPKFKIGEGAGNGSAGKTESAAVAVVVGRSAAALTWAWVVGLGVGVWMVVV